MPAGLSPSDIVPLTFEIFSLLFFFSDNTEFLFHEQSKKQKESKIQAYSIQIILTAVLP